MARQDAVDMAVVFRARAGSDPLGRSQKICFGVAPTAGLALLVALAATVGVDTTGWVAGIVTITAGCSLVGRGYRRQRMSVADLVTFTRFVLAVGVTALVADSLAGSVASFTFLAMPADNAWAVVALASVALVLDGADGAIARRTGTSSAIGARFDMEADAYLILVLSVGLVPTVGPWVVAIGLARYVFVLAASELPWLRRPLPPSMARKFVCVQQGVTLTVAAAPVVPWWVVMLGCVAALVGLSWSFGRDVAWLALSRRRDQATEDGFQTAVAPASPARTTRTSATIPAMAESAIEMR